MEPAHTGRIIVKNLNTNKTKFSSNNEKVNLFNESKTERTRDVNYNLDYDKDPNIKNVENDTYVFDDQEINFDSNFEAEDIIIDDSNPKTNTNTETNTNIDTNKNNDLVIDEEIIFANDANHYINCAKCLVLLACESKFFY
jgi:hypothetical protein